MTFRAVCLSQTEGAADGLGRAVAERLGYRYVDEEIVERAARIAQVDPSVVAATERKQSLLARVMEAMSSGAVLGNSLALAGGVLPEAGRRAVAGASGEDLRLLIRAAILEVAKTGDAVIVSHAASLALADDPGALRVLVTAPQDVRTERVAATSGSPATEASALVARSDEGRRAYLRKFYDVREELPTHYDLVLNTERLGAEVAVELIVAAFRGAQP